MSVKVGIIGGAGYTAGELLRILLNHPGVEVVFVQSASHAGEPVWKAHQDLFGETGITFTGEADLSSADVLFLCSGHGKSRPFLESSGYDGAVVDLSMDYRLKESAGDFVYGLPECNKAAIRNARHIANPGCFATAMLLALLPAKGICGEVDITGITGSTGAGQKPSETTHFSWRSSNISVYKPFTHQHLAEVGETLRGFSGFGGELMFVPVRGDSTRGILVSAYFDCDLSEEEAVGMYRDYYAQSPFVDVIDANPDIKMVTGTNKGFVHVGKYGRKLHVISVIDNLLKGASGQAVQNMNLMFGLEETAGLKFKAIRF